MTDPITPTELDRHTLWLANIVEDHADWIFDESGKACVDVELAVLVALSRLCAESGLEIDSPDMSNLFCVPSDIGSIHAPPHFLWEVGETEVFVEFTEFGITVQSRETRYYRSASFFDKVKRIRE